MLRKRRFFKFEFKVITLMTLMLVVVLSTGIIAYLRFSYLLENINNSMQPDSRLTYFHSIKSNLAELSNIAKTYSLTEDDSYRDSYVSKRKRIELDVKNVGLLNDVSVAKINLSRLDSLIFDRLVVLDGIMYAEDPYRVQTALSKVVTNIAYSEKETKKKQVRNNQITKQETKNSVEGSVDYQYIVENHEKLQEIEKEESRLLKKLKRAERRNDSDKASSLDSLIKLKKKEAQNIQKKITKEDELELEKKLTIHQIYSGIENVSQEELAIEREIKLNQLELISLDNLLGIKISKIIDNFEFKENEKLSNATSFANSESKKIAVVAAIFSAFVVILISLIIYIIASYVRKNRLYEHALKVSARETERLVKTRERLISTISHEIRTPMHAISGFAEQLSKQNLLSDQKEYVSFIQKSSKHLTYLINDVLDLSKLQSDKLKLNFQPFSFSDITDDIQGYITELSKDKNLKISFINDKKLATFYQGDEYRIRQILLNLISNAIKYTENGSVEVKIQLVDTSNQNDTIQFLVEDTGIGMSPEELKKAFSEFEQFSDTSTSKLMGTGLGLSITKRLVELFKGSIQVESEKGEGTKIKVELVLAQTELTKHEIQQDYSLPCTSILIVDDEDYNRKLIKAMLDPFLLEISEAENGKEALELLDKKVIDLVLLDARMPIMDGFQTIQAIRNSTSDQIKLLKVVLLTAADTEINDILDLVNGYVSKPFNEDKLISEINRVFKGISAKMNSDNELPVDFSNLKSLSGSDTNFYIEMLKTFIASTKKSTSIIQAAFLNDDWELLANESHKIASPCRHIGANNLHQLLKDVEQSARSTKKTSHLKETLKKLELEMTSVLEAINKELTQIGS
ncbi:MAG: ATP-binding protein [Crocinitomicaceae bacterium]|nr:ATP-binding protein [Crocinitomicaceae bacterium]